MRKLFYFFLILSLFTACNPCHRIQRLATKHPTCFKALNETKTDTGGVKIADRDSLADVTGKTITGIRDTFIKYLPVLIDTGSTPVQKQRAIEKVTGIIEITGKDVTGKIKNIPCLTDTVTFHPKDGYTLKLWQQGQDIKYSLSYPSVTYKLSDNRWPWYTWLSIGFGLAIVTAAGLIIWSRT